MRKEVRFERRIEFIETEFWPLPFDELVDPGASSSTSSSPESGELRMAQRPLVPAQGTRNYHRGTRYPTVSSDDLQHNFRKTSNIFSRVWKRAESEDDRQEQEELRMRLWTSCCCTCIVLLLLLTGALLATILAWFIIMPRKPDLRLLAMENRSVITIRSLHVNSSVPKSTVISDFSANITVVVENPNRVAISYSTSIFSLRYNDSKNLMNDSTLPAFLQQKHSNTSRAVHFQVSNFTSQPDSSLLFADIKKNILPLQIYGHTHARLHILGISAPPVMIEFLCSFNIKVKERMVLSKSLRCH